MERELDPAELKKVLSNVLELSTMSLATCGPGGEPHAADVYFASDDGLTLYFFSDQESQHGMDIRRDPRVAITIHADRSGWEQILGVQMRGLIDVIVSKTAWQRAWEVYRDKFPFVSQLEDVIAENQLFGFVPHWIRLVDNNQGFGFNREWILSISEKDGETMRVWQMVSDQGKSAGVIDG